MYDKQGKYGEALELHEQSVAILIKVLGKDHVDVAASYNNMAGVYSKQGKYGEALELHEQSLAIRIKVLGKDHADVSCTERAILRLKTFLQDSQASDAGPAFSFSPPSGGMFEGFGRPPEGGFGGARLEDKKAVERGPGVTQAGSASRKPGFRKPGGRGRRGVSD